MKIILLQDVARIGRRYEVVDVPDGYAFNQLIPKRMAEPATPANLKRIEKMTTDKASLAEADSESFKTAVEAIKTTPIEIIVEANEKGHLFKAVGADEVVAAAKEAGVGITEEMIEFSSPVKEIGSHEVALKHGEEQVTISITISSK